MNRLVIICGFLITVTAQNCYTQSIELQSFNSIGDYSYLPNQNSICSMGDAITMHETDNSAGFTNILSDYQQVKSLTIKVFIEGLFNPILKENRPVYISSTPIFSGNVSDTLSLYFFSLDVPKRIVGIVRGAVLETNGLIRTIIPKFLPDSVQVSIYHRSSIETWINPPILTASHNYFDLTTSSHLVFGANLKCIDSTYCLYTGDVNQDGIIDALDFILIDNRANMGDVGYFPEDLNGDGNVNNDDYFLIIPNAKNFVMRIKPE